MTGKLINTDSTKMELRVYQLVSQLSRKFILSILMDAGKNSNFRRSSYTLLDDARNERLTLIGLDTASFNQRINLTQLCRNSRSRKDKTSGRKRPRVDDCDVVAAPDSPSSRQYPIHRYPIHRYPIHQCPIHRQLIHQYPIHRYPIHQCPIH